MNTKKLSIGNNIIFLLFFTSIFFDYSRINRIYTVLYFAALAYIVVDIIQLYKRKVGKIQYSKKLLILLLIFILLTSFMTGALIRIIGLLQVEILYKTYIYIVLVCFKLYLHGEKYIRDFYKWFVVLINTFAIINLYEIVTKKSLFYQFLEKGIYTDMTIFGTNAFRTFSIFEHPIVYGLFLVILFWCNKFIINNKLKYILQANIFVNIFFTQSRSAYIALAITLVIYYFKIIFDKCKNYKFVTTYKKIFAFISTIVISTILICIFYKDIGYILSNITDRFITATNDSYGATSRLQRLGTISVIIDFMQTNGVANFLFGHGFSTVQQFMLTHQIVIIGFKTTDNQYITFFYEFGFIGLLLYVLILIASIIRFFKSTNIFSMNNLSILCFWTISIAMFFFESFGWKDVFIFMIIIMVFICAKDNKSTENIPQ